MNSMQKEVLRKIIYAVETGGQVYGRQDYANFTEAYTNSSAEHAITIGAGQWYGEEAKRLLNRIKKENPSLFSSLDTAGIACDLIDKNWSIYRIVKTSAKAKCIVEIINSAIGHKCQDMLVDEQMDEYVREAYKLGVLEAAAQAMCANFRHQGGYSAVTRILAKAKKPYTLDSLYAACKMDTGNQVGAYRSRQKMVYESLKKYFLDGGVDKMSVVEKAVKQMEAWAQDNSHGYDQIYRWGEKGDYDCSAAVIQACENAGIPVKTGGATYTGNMLSVFKRCGFVDVTAQVNRTTGSGLVRGDVLLNTTHHAAMYCGNGKEVEASINEKGTATGGKPGDQTGREFLIRSYRNYPWTHILRYTGGETNADKGYLAQGDSGEAVKTMQIMLIKLGYSCGVAGADGDFGSGTEAALRKFQLANNLEVDGQYGRMSKSKLEELYKKTAEKPSEGTARELSKTPKWVGKSTVNGLAVRTWAGTDNPQIQSWPILNEGNKVDVCDSLKASDGSVWYYIRIAGHIYGFVHSSYIARV